MKITLVALNAKYIHSNLAVYSLMAYAKKYAGQIGLVEMTINHLEEDILKEIYKEKADVVAFSCYIWNIGIITRVSAELKKVQPEVKIWFGGPEVSYDAEKRLKSCGWLDGVMIGEGEQTFLELAGYYAGESIRLENIAGLAFKATACISQTGKPKKQNPQEAPAAYELKQNYVFSEENQIISGESQKLPEENQISSGENPVQEEIPEFAEGKYLDPLKITVTPCRPPMALDSIPFPYEDMEHFRNRILYYESSRGCPFSCSYCLSSIDKAIRFRSTELVKKELKLFLDFLVPQVKFVDRTFNCNKKHAMDIWKFIQDNDNGITNFHFEIAADLLDEEEIALLSTLRPGQVQFEIGVQTTNPNTIEAIRRRMDLGKVSENSAKIREGRNIHQHLDLIAGLPLEGYASFEKSFNEVYRMRPDQLQLGFLKVLKGSFMEEETKKYGITYRDTPPYEVLFTDSLTYEELLSIKGICEMVEIYYNSGQFTCSIRFLEHFYDSPMELYRSLGEFYEQQDIALMAHNRIKRYEILLDFYNKEVLESVQAENKEEMTELYQELLIYDLYLREDLQSKPSFYPMVPKQSGVKHLYEKYQTGRRSIHIEQFHFDPVESAETGRPVRKAIVLLFDYSSRDPLNKAAKTEVLPIKLS